MAKKASTTGKTQERQGKKDGLDSVRAKELEQGINRAEATVLKNKAACETLHAQWRLYLLLLSFLLILVSMYQAQLTVSSCLKDIMAVNSRVNDPFSGYQAAGIVSKEALVQLASIVVGGFQMAFLAKKDPHSDFKSPYYTIINACVPALLGLYFNKPKVGCVDDLLRQQDIEPSNRTANGFPVAVVFHVIVTACYWFMDAQARQHETNVVLVENMRKEMLGDPKKGKQTKKTK